MEWLVMSGELPHKPQQGHPAKPLPNSGHSPVLLPFPDGLPGAARQRTQRAHLTAGLASCGQLPDSTAESCCLSNSWMINDRDLATLPLLATKFCLLMDKSQRHSGAYRGLRRTLTVTSSLEDEGSEAPWDWLTSPRPSPAKGELRQELKFPNTQSLHSCVPFPPFPEPLSILKSPSKPNITGKAFVFYFRRPVMVFIILYQAEKKPTIST